jgi:hypothetical protein
MRGREFIMKDAYSFHADEDCLRRTYAAMDGAYRRIFARCGLRAVAVEADSGAIGGSASQEFMVTAESGEDLILTSDDGRYAANQERAVSLPPEAEPLAGGIRAGGAGEPLQTPGETSIENLCTAHGFHPSQLVKVLLQVASFEDGLRMFAMSRALSRDPMTRNVFEYGGAEVTAVAADPFTGLWFKTRPDWLRTDSGLIVNLKTALSAKPAEWERQAFTLGYHVGAAHSISVLDALTERPHHYAFVVCEKEPPYCAITCVFKPEVLAWGGMICTAAAARFAQCIDANDWPGYADSVLELGLPPWAEKQLQNRQEAGEFS